MRTTVLGNWADMETVGSSERLERIAPTSENASRMHSYTWLQACFKSSASHNSQERWDLLNVLYTCGMQIRLKFLPILLFWVCLLPYRSLPVWDSFFMLQDPSCLHQKVPCGSYLHFTAEVHVILIVTQYTLISLPVTEWHILSHVWSDYWRIFLLMIEFIGLSRHSPWLHFTIHCHTHTRTRSIVTSSVPLLGSSFQRRTFPFLWVPELSPCLSYQLLTVTAHNDWTTAVISLT
jgi:hypothetical protein